MERSTGANTIPNLFGAGKDGFGDGVGPPPTELNASWFNNTQEEIARAIEDQGFAVGGTLDQLTVALNSWQWSGSPSIKAGATFTILSGGELNVESGGDLDIKSGGFFQSLAGSNSVFWGTTIFTPSATFTCNTDADFNANVNIADTSTLTLGANVIVNAGNDLAVTVGTDAVVVYGSGSSLEIELGQFLTVEFDDTGILLPPNPRGFRFAETTLVVHGDDAVIRSVSVPDRGYDAAFTTPNAIDTTAAICSRRLQETEQVWLRVTFDYQHTSGLLGTLNTRIQVSGPGVIDLNTKSYELKAAGGVRWRMVSFVFPWAPIDDFVAPGTTGYVFTVRVGSDLGLDLEVRDIGIEVVSNVRV